MATDSEGNVVWEGTFGGARDDIGNSVQENIDGGYIVVGTRGYRHPGAPEVYLVKTDPQGNILWEKTFGGSGRSVHETTSNRLKAIQQ